MTDAGPVVLVGIVGVMAGLVLGALVRSVGRRGAGSASSPSSKQAVAPTHPSRIMGIAQGPVEIKDWRCSCDDGRLFAEAVVVRVQRYSDGHRYAMCDRVLVCRACGRARTWDEIQKEASA